MIEEATPTTKATIKEVAERAGVSIASVSRAQNGKPGLSDETRRKILEVCSQLNYVPNKSALELMKGGENLVGIYITKGMHSSRYMAMMWPHLAEALHHKGKTLFPIPAGSPQEQLDQIKAAITFGAGENDLIVKQLKIRKVPFVSIGIMHDAFWVAPDDFNGLRVLTEHLLKCGRKNLAFVTTEGAGVGYRMRYQGYMTAMATYNLPIREFRIGQHQLVEIAAYRFFSQLTPDEMKTIDGLLCQSDEIAAAVQAALDDLGFKIPEQIIVTGYDGLPEISDNLTTIVQDLDAIAQQAIELLEEACTNQPLRGQIVPVTLRTHFRTAPE